MTHLEVGGMAGPVGLRRDHEIVGGGLLLAPWNDVVEGKAVVGTVEHEHRGGHVHGVPGARAGLDFPPLGEARAQRVELPVEIVRAVPLQRHLVPVEPIARLGIGGQQVRRFPVVEIREQYHRLWVLGEAVGELLQSQAHVFEAYLLAGDDEGYGGELRVQPAQHVCHHGTVPGARVEDVQRRRGRAQVAQLVAHPFADRPFLPAGGDEEEVLLPVVEEAKGALVSGGRGVHGRRNIASRRACHFRAIRKTDSSPVSAWTPSAGTHSRAWDSSFFRKRPRSATSRKRTS